LHVLFVRVQCDNMLPAQACPTPYYALANIRNYSTLLTQTHPGVGEAQVCVDLQSELAAGVGTTAVVPCTLHHQPYLG